jgi:outer membrane protein
MRLIAALALVLLAPPAGAQQKLGYVDSNAILQLLPEYQSARQEVDRLAAQWQAELGTLQREVDAMERDYAARELLYTPDERTRRREEIEARVTEVEQYRRRKFGTDGELFREEQQRMRPVQQRVLEAIQTVAEENDYGFVFDRSGAMIFLYARPADNLTELVLEELGVDPTRAGAAAPTTAPAGGNGR